jgi:THO complex subunit 4
MSALDKSLDDIIKSSGKKSIKPKKFANKSKPTKVGKSLRTTQKKPVSFKKVAVAKPTVDLSYATKVVVYGLPKDLKQDNIKVCSHVLR